MPPIRRLFEKFSSFSASARGERMQRGQAMSEYWPTIPAGILIMLSATAIVGIITGALNKAVEGLTGTGLTCEEETSEVVEGRAMPPPAATNSNWLPKVTTPLPTERRSPIR
ncbi:MAG: hypothetical protein M5R40_08195 [Anaerolineae bacterium]|nr:hypothetical protein [Anaerolineae bacterium]